jgi:hypothetical protein
MAARPEEWATESDGIERRPQWDNGVASALLRLRTRAGCPIQPMHYVRGAGWTLGILVAPPW